MLILIFAGCSKCLKAFARIEFLPGKFKSDISGFNINSWPARNGTQHKIDAAKTRSAVNGTHQKQLEQFGCRWSELFELEYFDPIRGHSIDPMHCLFLGIAKTVTKHYLTTGLIPKAKIKSLQAAVDMIRVPSSIGRIPRKISSGFASFTADQWKNWTLIYSPLVLRDVLPTKHYRIWMTFVNATKLITRKTIKKQDVTLAKQLYIKFCLSIEQEFGEAFITPNFHMLCHLPDVMDDYGPVYSFWCYSFER